MLCYNRYERAVQHLCESPYWKKYISSFLFYNKIDSGPEKRNTHDHVDGREKVPVWRGRRHGYGSSRAYGMTQRGTVAQIKNIQVASGRTQSSALTPYGNQIFLQFSYISAVPVRMDSTDLKMLSLTSEGEGIQSPLKLTWLSTMDRVMGLMAERDELVIRLNEYKIFSEKLHRKVSGQDATIQAI